MATAKKTVPTKAPARKVQAVKPTLPPAAKAAAPVSRAAAAAAQKAVAPASKPTATAPKAAVRDTATKLPKLDKPKKPKLVRDSFTIPKTEYLVLEELKQRAGKLGTPAKKSEVLRAGVKALAAMADAEFRAALGVVPAIKTGRPANTSA